MESGVTVTAGMQISLLERTARARGGRILLVSGGTIAVILSISPDLVGHAVKTGGIADLVPALAPPLGLGARWALAGLTALVSAALLWSIGAAGGSTDKSADFLKIEDEDAMMQAQTKSPLAGWGALIRLVRGGPDECGDATSNWAERSRRDQHPDAPPRTPLLASRDLPAHGTEPLQTEAPTETARDAMNTDGKITPLAEMAARLEGFAPAVPPRAPEPFSDEELAEAIAALPPRRVTLPVRARPADLLDELDLPLVPGANVIDLAVRFEQGLARRQAVIHAEEAQHMLAERLPLAQGDPCVRAALRARRPVEVVMISRPATAEAPAADAPSRVDVDVEAALDQALATLRKLAEQGRR